MADFDKLVAALRAKIGADATAERLCREAACLALHALGDVPGHAPASLYPGWLADFKPVGARPDRLHAAALLVIAAERA